MEQIFNPLPHIAENLSISFFCTNLATPRLEFETINYLRESSRPFVETVAAALEQQISLAETLTSTTHFPPRTPF
jgi:hypothetical protein